MWMILGPYRWTLGGPKLHLDGSRRWISGYSHLLSYLSQHGAGDNGAAAVIDAIKTFESSYSHYSRHVS
jgi:hypothetical protein